MTTPTYIVEAFTADTILMDLPAGSKEQVVESLVSCAISAKVLPRTRRQQAVEAILDREGRGSTAFGGGVAVPHARLQGLRRAVGVMARSPEGVDFRATDGERVHVFLLLVSPEARAEEHLATLRWISRLARARDFVSFILQARSPEGILEVLQEPTS